jgi:hypothetical protein
MACMLKKLQYKEYVRDFIVRRTAEGSTVAVMVARGLMDLPIRGFNCFHGARWEDGHVTSQVIRAAMSEGQMLTAVGKLYFDFCQKFNHCRVLIFPLITFVAVQ